MAVEFRGCKNLVYAEVLVDDKNRFVTGTVKPLAPVAEISKTVETSSATHYYDNKGAIIIDAEGSDTVTFTIAVPPDETYADITGRTYDSTKKVFIESKREQKYFAVGYVLGEIGEGEDERYVWRYKGTFNIPDEGAKTEDNGTDASNLSLVYTGAYTEHDFVNGKGTGRKGAAKSMFIRHSDDVMTESAWFAQVVTPDNFSVAANAYSITFDLPDSLTAEGATSIYSSGVVPITLIRIGGGLAPAEENISVTNAQFEYAAGLDSCVIVLHDPTDNVVVTVTEGT